VSDREREKEKERYKKFNKDIKIKSSTWAKTYENINTDGQM
jgi:hypothetical protein